MTRYAKGILVSFNIKGVLFDHPSAFRRAKKFCEFMQRSDADVIQVQEVHTYALAHYLTTQLAAYPFVSYVSGLWGPAGGLVTYSKLPLGPRSFIPLSDAFKNPPQSLYASLSALQRLHKGILVSHQPSSGLVFINIHLSANWTGDWSNRNDIQQMQMAELDVLCSVINRLQASGRDAAILSGDFNLSDESPLYSTFLNREHLLDAFEDNRKPTFHEGFLPEGRSPHRIDYILLRTGRAKLRVTEAERLFEKAVPFAGQGSAFLSDHVGLKVKYLYDDLFHRTEHDGITR